MLNVIGINLILWFRFRWNNLSRKFSIRMSQLVFKANRSSEFDVATKVSLYWREYLVGLRGVASPWAGSVLLSSIKGRPYFQLQSDSCTVHTYSALRKLIEWLEEFHLRCFRVYDPTRRLTFISKYFQHKNFQLFRIKQCAPKKKCPFLGM